MGGKKVMLSIAITGDLLAEEFSQAAKIAEERNPGEVNVHVMRRFRFESVSAVNIAGIVSGLAGLCSLLILIRKELTAWQEARSWSADKLRRKVEDEMFRLGVTDFKIYRIRGFNALFSKESDFCCIEAFDTTEEHLYRIYISLDGSTYSIKVERSIDN